MSELVSVIVPVYNIEEYLPRCLSCIKAQTYTNLEIILVDDGSTDGSGRLCDEYAASDPRARVIHHPENRGLWAARNTGQDAAHGDYLWMPDGDDYFHKDIVKIMYEAINRIGSDGLKYDLAMVGCKRTNYLDQTVSSAKELSYFEVSDVEMWDRYLHPIKGFKVTSIWNKLFRQKNVEGIRSGNYKYAQDWDFVFQLLKTGPRTVYVDNDLYWWRIRPGSAMQADDYQYVSLLCRTRIEYTALISCENEVYRRFLLEGLYVSIALLLERIGGSDNADAVRCECRKMIGNSWWDYLRCREIRNLGKRVRRILRVCWEGHRGSCL